MLKEFVELDLITTSDDRIDPRYSRPLDVHRFSAHREIAKLASAIWRQAFCVPETPTGRRGGARPKATSFQQVKVLLLDLYVAWKTDPALSIGVHLSNTAWNTNSRYNRLHLSRKIPRLLNVLEFHELIHVSKGSYAGPGASTNRTARIIAAEPLRKLFREAKFGLQHILTAPNREVIIMHGDRGSAKEVEYEDTNETVAMRQQLTNYSNLLARTFIDIPDQVEPFVFRPIKKGPQQGSTTRVPICTMDNRVNRIFNRNSWDCGGRFYGGWWQGVGSELRKKIHINDRPTIEVDYRALHIGMLNARHGVTVEGDPYELEAGLIASLDQHEQRKIIKTLVLMAINARDRTTACQAFRQSNPVGSVARSMKNVELLRLLDAFIEKFPHLKPDLCSDMGIRLMKKDSEIANHVLTGMTRKGIPVLCVHDSFIVDYEHGQLLKTVMHRVSQHVVGHPIPVSNNYQGLDEVRASNPELVDDYERMRHLDRCHEYRVRQRLFAERVSYLGSLG